MRSHVYVSERRGRSGGAWVVTHQQQRFALYQTYSTSTSSLSQDAGTNDSSSLFSHQLQGRGHRDAMTTKRRRSYIRPDRRGQVLGLALSRNALARLGAARSQWSPSSLRRQATRPRPPPVHRRGACFPLFAHVRTCSVILVAGIRTSPPQARLALAVRNSLTLRLGISQSSELEDTAEVERRGNPYKDEKKHVGGLCECRCA